MEKDKYLDFLKWYLNNELDFKNYATLEDYVNVYLKKLDDEKQKAKIIEHLNKWIDLLNSDKYKNFMLKENKYTKDESSSFKIFGIEISFKEK